MILDIIAIAILALSIIFGYKKGLVKTILGAASFLIAIILVFFLMDPAVSMISNSSFGEAINEHCYTLVGAAVEDTASGQTTGNGSVLPQALLDALADSGASQAIDRAQAQMAQTLSEWVIKAICFVGLFIAVNLLLLILKPILNGLFKLPVLSLVNKVGGVIAGAVNGGIILLILSCALLWLTTTEFAGSWCTDQLARSQFAAVIYYNNPILNLFK